MPERILRIGVDIDDVLFHSAQRSIDLYNQGYGTSLTIDDWYTESTDKTYWKESWGSDERAVLVNRVVSTNASDEFKSVEVMSGAREVLEALKSQGHNLFAVTGRPEAIRSHTSALLERAYPEIFHDDVLFFVDHFEHNGRRANKADVALELGLTHFIEDLPAHANAVSRAGIRTLLFDLGYPWNQTGVDEAVTRVRSWQEIGALLDAEARR